MKHISKTSVNKLVFQNNVSIVVYTTLYSATIKLDTNFFFKVKYFEPLLAKL